MDVGFSASSMTDLIFLLLLFMMLSTTLINPNAVKLTLPKSSNQIKDKAATSVSITADERYYLETEPIQFDMLEAALQQKLQGQEDPVIALHTDEMVPVKEVVKVMNIAMKNKYKIFMATRPE